MHGPDVELDGAEFDSRLLSPGRLFVPIVAERDGHDFVADAVGHGAPAYLTARGRVEGVDAVAIEVADTVQALMDAAAWARGRLHARAIGLTGSVGKTSTKDLLAGALGTTFAVTANERSFNNEQGLPVTILNADERTEVLVLEMGMRGWGEISRLCEVARPDLGIVTTVGASHTERVGGVDGVAKAKRELVEALDPSGTAILNADDPRVDAMAEYTVAGVLRYGTASMSDIHVTDLQLDELARARFTVRTPWGEARIRLAVSGAHMAGNAAAAIAAAGVLGVPLDTVAASLERTGVSEMRMEVTRTQAGALVVNDAYNANPTSMMAALDALAAMDAMRRIAVLGPMAELEDPDEAHRQVAAYAAELGVQLVAVGTDLYGVAAAQDPLDALGVLGAGDAVLVKASRVAGLEWVARRLAGDA
ncbi:UDP-N-acetylmuramoyl-tripeptide--D-alanyl-D-alanine ligase [soil metagenome]|jgi:UDP-N-acetylmuramoyl-tripeptide--D-alanyl-D-alanine ligase